MKTLLLTYKCWDIVIDNSTEFEDFRLSMERWKSLHLDPELFNPKHNELTKMIFVEMYAEGLPVEETHVCTVYVKPRGINHYYDWYSAWCHIRSMCEKYEREELPEFSTDREGRF